MSSKSAEAPFAISVATVDGVDVLSVRGEIDLASAPLLRDRLAELGGDREGDLVLDLTEVVFLDSTGIHTLLNAQRRMVRRQRKMRIVCSSGPVYRVLEIARLFGTFDVYATREEAVRASSGATPS